MSKDRYLILITCLLLTGCIGARILPTEPPEQLARLKTTAKTSLALSVSYKENLEQTQDLGFQYVLGIIPAARVVHTDIIASVCNQLELSLAKEGLNASCKAETLLPALVVKIEKVEVNGYDFIFFRRPNSNIELSAELLDKSGRIIRKFTAIKAESATQRYAFATELTTVFEDSLKAVTEELASVVSQKPF